jgi:hypothetical protein
MAEEGKLDPVVGREIERVCSADRRKRTTLSLLVNLGWKIRYCRRFSFANHTKESVKNLV